VGELPGFGGDGSKRFMLRFERVRLLPNVGLLICCQL
jgi:hypothetical protein